MLSTIFSIMASRNSGSAGGGTGSKTVPKSKPASFPLDRILQISVLQHSAQMSYDLVLSVVPELSVFEKDWVDDNVTGASIVNAGPNGIHSLLKGSFPEMTADIRVKILKCYEIRIAEEAHKGGDFIPQHVASMWAQLSSQVVPVALFAVDQRARRNDPPKFVFGPCNQFSRLPSASAAAGNFSPQSQLTSAQAQQRSSSGVAFQSPDAARSASANSASASAVGQGVANASRGAGPGAGLNQGAGPGAGPNNKGAGPGAGPIQGAGLGAGPPITFSFFSFCIYMHNVSRSSCLNDCIFASLYALLLSISYLLYCEPTV